MILLRQLRQREDGQDLIEYGLLASLIAIVALASVRMMSTHITDVLWGAIAAIRF
jgi:Flp pilus assembly pilin Flp